MTKQYFILCFCAAALCLSSHTNAGKLYKIVGPDGAVTFSQYPPAEKTEESSVEDIKVRNSGNTALSVSQKGTRFYCGDIQLPDEPLIGRDQSRFYSRVLDRQERWENDLENLELRLENSIQRQFERNQKHYYSDSQRAQYNLQQQKQKDQQIEKIKALRCAINWAEERQNGVNTLRFSTTDEVARLRQVHKNLQVGIDRQCGTKPIFDPSDPAKKHALTTWESCSKDLRKDLRQVEREMRNASNNIQRTY